MWKSSSSSVHLESSVTFKTIQKLRLHLVHRHSDMHKPPIHSRREIHRKGASFFTKQVPIITIKNQTPRSLPVRASTQKVVDLLTYYHNQLPLSPDLWTNLKGVYCNFEPPGANRVESLSTHAFPNHIKIFHNSLWHSSCQSVVFQVVFQVV